MTLSIRGLYIRYTWLLELYVLKVLHTLFPHNHVWYDFELPDCYPCCGEGMEDVVATCRGCHRRRYK